MVESGNYRVSYVVFISSVAAIGGFLFGFDSAVINGTVSAIAKVFGSGSVGSGFSVASMLLGCAFGALNAGNWADRVGRRPVMKVAALAFIVSAWGSGVADSASFFIVFRLLGGLAVGAASVIAPTYISEVAPARVRGRLASLQQMAIVIGIFTAFISNYLIASASGGASHSFLLGFDAWKWMFWAEIIPAFLYFIFSFVVPESPRYLVAAGKMDSAFSVLKLLWKDEKICSDEVDAIAKTVKADRRPKFFDIIHNGRLLPIVWVGIVLSFFQQLVGINVVFYYGSVLWESAGFSESDALIINVISGLVNIVSTVFAILLIDRLGRRPLLIAGSIGMAVTLGVMAVVFSLADAGAAGQLVLSPVSGKIALVAANLYVFCFGISWGPVVWVLLGEMFNNKIRGAAISVAAGAQWVANFAVTMTFPIILGSIGLFGAYGIYSLFAVLSFVFVFRFVRETKGKTLEEMS